MVIALSSTWDAVGTESTNNARYSTHRITEIRREYRIKNPISNSLEKHVQHKQVLRTLQITLWSKHAVAYDMPQYAYMSPQLGSEVERQGKANKSTAPGTALSFQRKEEELPWVGFEPTTLCSLGERSTN